MGIGEPLGRLFDRFLGDDKEDHRRKMLKLREREIEALERIAAAKKRESERRE